MSLDLFRLSLIFLTLQATRFGTFLCLSHKFSEALALHVDVVSVQVIVALRP